MTTPPLNRPVFTMTEAANLAGVSRSTIRRRRESGKFPEAYKTPDGDWMIPLTNLLAEGLGPRSSDRALGDTDGSGGFSEPLTDHGQGLHRATVSELAHLREQLQFKEHQLELERARSEGLAETLAATRARANDLSLALRILEPGKKVPEPDVETEAKEPIAMPAARPAPAAEVPEAAPPAAPPVVPTEQPRKGWWGRLISGE